MTAPDEGPPPATLVADVQVARDGFTLRAALEVAPGAVLAVLGPNGAGKSTLLRALAGLVPLDGGRVVLDGAVLDAPPARPVPPEERPVGVVFQDHLLFPHLDARDNVAFGLRAGGMARAPARRAADALLERLGLADRAGARPAALSGGEAQRVALARALARGPALLLLDEPLAALDAGTRAAVRRTLRAEVDGFTGATVLVTHDPIDAFALADEVLVLEHGTVAQAGPVTEVVHRPRTRFVADLLGVNLLRGEAAGARVRARPVGPHGAPVPGAAVTEVTLAEPAQGPVFVCFAPQAVALHPTEPAGSVRNRWAVRIAGLNPLGDRVRVDLTGGVQAVAEITAAAAAELGAHEGQDLWAAVKATEVTTYAV